jgi:uncharacterized protein (TIGR02246 family)
MRKTTMWTTVMAAVSMLLAAGAQAREAPDYGEDARQIRALQEQFTEAWNRGDAEGMARIFADDGDFVNPAGRVARGRDEVERLYREDHEAAFRGSRFASTCGQVRFLTRDVAELDCRFQVSGVRGPEGRLMTMRGLYTVVLARRDGEWRTVTARAMIPMPDPGEMRPRGPHHRHPPGPGGPPR